VPIPAGGQIYTSYGLSYWRDLVPTTMDKPTRQHILRRYQTDVTADLLRQAGGQSSTYQYLRLHGFAPF